MIIVFFLCFFSSFQASEILIHYLNGHVVTDLLVEASWHTAVLCGVDEDRGSKDVMQQVASQSVTLLTLEVEGQLQNLDQVRAIG